MIKKESNLQGIIDKIDRTYKSHVPAAIQLATAGFLTYIAIEYYHEGIYSFPEHVRCHLSSGIAGLACGYAAKSFHNLADNFFERLKRKKEDINEDYVEKHLNNCIKEANFSSIIGLFGFAIGNFTITGYALGMKMASSETLFQSSDNPKLAISYVGLGLTIASAGFLLKSINQKWELASIHDNYFPKK